MEQKLNSRGLEHQLLVRLDDNLIHKLRNHSTENDMSMSGIVRRSLRQFFQREESKDQKIMKMK